MPTKKPSATKDTFEQHYFEKVYDVTRLIPRGKVSTYGAIADFLGLGSARMVGWALNHCHNSDHTVPAHRVVNRLGELSGRLHFATPDMMQKKLEAENISVENNKILNFETIFWHPRELENY